MEVVLILMKQTHLFLLFPTPDTYFQVGLETLNLLLILVPTQLLLQYPTASVTIAPSFTPKTYQITLNSDNNGTTTGGGNYSYGTTTNIFATGNGANADAPAGYVLASWTITNQSGQVSQSSSNPLALNVDGNYSIFANFEPD